MTRFIPASRLACLVTVIAAGIASIPAANFANAKGSSSNAGSATSGNPHFVITGQPVNVKRVQSSHNDTHKDRKDRKHAERMKKHCVKIIVPTAGCPTSPKDPVGSVSPPTFKSSAKGPSPAFTSATISNGVLTSAIFNGKGLTVTSNSPGTLTVSNGTTSVTLPGGSLTLHGASSVSVPAGYQLVTHANGDVTVAISPVLASAPAGSYPAPPGVGLTDNIKAAAGAANIIPAYPTIGVMGLAAVGPAATMGLMAGDVGGALNDVDQFVLKAAGRVLDWW